MGLEMRLRGGREEVKSMARGSPGFWPSAFLPHFQRRKQGADKLDACQHPVMQLLENLSVFCAIATLRKLLTKAHSPLSTAC
jgi:hypothetical protein